MPYITQSHKYVLLATQPCKSHVIEVQVNM